ncbi:MAG: SAF domain-containing protein [Acidimicrobiales bacterium]
MAQTTLPPRSPARPGPGPGAARPAPAVVSKTGRQRRWSLALLAVLLTVGSALAFVVLWMNAGERKPVLAMANDVTAGQTIEASDLVVVRVSTEAGVTPIPASERGDVIGQVASVDLLAGSLLVENAIGENRGLEAGSALIAVPVPVQELPSPDLEAGDRVIVYRTSTGLLEEEGASAQEIGEGRVSSVEAGDSSQDTVSVSLAVDQGLVSDIAASIQADQIYLALIPSG